MKIKVEFLDKGYKDAILIKGWWNKKIARVVYDVGYGWVYHGSDIRLESNYVDLIGEAREKAKQREKDAQWIPPARIPRARVFR